MMTFSSTTWLWTCPEVLQQCKTTKHYFCRQPTLRALMDAPTATPCCVPSHAILFFSFLSTPDALIGLGQYEVPDLFVNGLLITMVSHPFCPDCQKRGVPSAGCVWTLDMWVGCPSMNVHTLPPSKANSCLAAHVCAAPHLLISCLCLSLLFSLSLQKRQPCLFAMNKDIL